MVLEERCNSRGLIDLEFVFWVSAVMSVRIMVMSGSSISLITYKHETFFQVSHRKHIQVSNSDLTRRSSLPLLDHFRYNMHVSQGGCYCGCGSERRETGVDRSLGAPVSLSCGGTRLQHPSSEDTGQRNLIQLLLMSISRLVKCAYSRNCDVFELHVFI